MHNSSLVTGGCIPPDIPDFSVSLNQSSEETEIHSLLTWNAVNHTMNACVVVEWSVRYASWPSNRGLPENDFTAPPYAIWSHPFKLPAIANSAFVAKLNITSYHIFQLSADFETQPISKLVINSHIYNFQDQGDTITLAPSC